MELSGQQHKHLRDALISAFPTYSLLEQLLDFELDKKLNQITQDSDLQTVAYQLIQRAQAEGWLLDLVRAARKENPGSSQLEAIATELLTPEISSSEAPVILPNIVRESNQEPSSNNVAGNKSINLLLLNCKRIIACFIDLFLLTISCQFCAAPFFQKSEFQHIGILISLIIIWLYFALFESSSRQATPGKEILKIKVTDLDGKRIYFWHATRRILVKLCFTGLCLFLGIGFFINILFKSYHGRHSLYEILTCTQVRLKKTPPSVSALGDSSR